MVESWATHAELEALLLEDAPHGDLTTEALGIADLPAVMRFSARGDMVVAGLEGAVGLIELVGGEVVRRCADGDRVAAGTPLLEAKGRADALHRAWKQAQTTMEILSGIATATREIVEAIAVAGRIVPVACTRKSFPGVRRFSAAAVRAGGGVSHRHGLSETILVFAEHRAFLPGLTLGEMVDRLRAAAPEKKTVIEVATPEAAIAAARAGFEVIQTEKFSPADVERTVVALRGSGLPTLVAAAGGISPTNAAAYVAAGADVIVTSWPYTARPRDVAVRLGPPAP
ncbi:MAG: ModD protein [Phyllobacteriaceae bacterium]|nr:ModD protein [Phyllobacteriaceae bacterium]